MKRYKLIGLTGQSGAGKSTVAQVFAALGATVISADDIVRGLYTAQSPCVKTIAAVFGADCLNSDGTVNRPVLAQRAFASADNTAMLGRLVHPFVMSALLKALKHARGVVVFDAPQLFEADADVICDCVIAVVADEAVRKQRIMERDGLSPEQAQSRMNAQLSEAFFRAHADMILENNGNGDALRQAAEEIYRQHRTIQSARLA